MTKHTLGRCGWQLKAIRENKQSSLSGSQCWPAALSIPNPIQTPSGLDPGKPGPFLLLASFSKTHFFATSWEISIPVSVPPHMQSCLLLSSSLRSLSLSYNLQHGDLLVFHLAFFSTDFFFLTKLIFSHHTLTAGSLWGPSLAPHYSSSIARVQMTWKHHLAQASPSQRGGYMCILFLVTSPKCPQVQTLDMLNVGLSFELEELAIFVLMSPIQTTV